MTYSCGRKYLSVFWGCQHLLLFYFFKKYFLEEKNTPAGRIDDGWFAILFPWGKLLIVKQRSLRKKLPFLSLFFLHVVFSVFFWDNGVFFVFCFLVNKNHTSKATPSLLSQPLKSVVGNRPAADSGKKIPVTKNSEVKNQNVSVEIYSGLKLRWANYPE